MDTKHNKPSASFWGLTPLLVFLLVYLASSLALGDFYAMPISVGFIIASAYALVITRGIKLEERLKIFTGGASDSNILSMIWIFVLAGAFASGAKEIGAIESTVNTILSILPPSLLLPGLFLASCLISLSIGTSVGTIVALTPVALGFADKLGVDIAYMCSIIVGGAFFGDNLSFISDTTIAATKTQEVEMKDKFRTNFLIVLPAAIACLIIYTISGADLNGAEALSNSKGLLGYALLLPYVIVIVTALMGLNVLVVLTLGILSCGVLALAQEVLQGEILWAWVKSLGSGINGMGELIIVTLLAGGLLALIRYNGGIDYLMQTLTKRIQGRRGGELSIAILVSIANICTANNTIAILTAGGVARNISEKYGIAPRRSASLLDTFSCAAQGLLPYGAQLLLAAGFASISPISIIPSLYYPMLLGVCATLAIILGYPRVKDK